MANKSSCKAQSATTNYCGKSPTALNLKEAIEGYVQGSWKDSHVKFCIQQPSLVKAIKVAASAKNENGTIHSHQRRPYSKFRFEKFAHQLKEVEREISQVKNFDELIQIVNSQRFPYIGDLMVYDTAYVQ